MRALPPEFQPGALRELQIPAALERVYAARGVDSPAALEAGLNRLLAPADLSGLEAAVQLLMQAITHQQQIVIVAPTTRPENPGPLASHPTRIPTSHQL